VRQKRWIREVEEHQGHATDLLERSVGAERRWMELPTWWAATAKLWPTVEEKATRDYSGRR
jgi:hypothetical protein